ncbi:MAG: hypothetical protein ABFS14_09860 [Gemmatimonadota bacterium]
MNTETAFAAVEVRVFRADVRSGELQLQLTVAGRTEIVPSDSSSVVFDDLPTGSASLELLGLTVGCSAAGGSFLDLDLRPAETESVRFTVACPPGTGGIEVTNSTTGIDRDTDGYVVRIDGSREMTTPPNAMIFIENVEEGTHTVELAELAPQCEARQAISTVTVRPDLITPITLNVDCGPQLVYSSTRDGNPELHAANGDGADPVRLTFDPASDTDPDASPDGQQVVFISTRTGPSEIFLLDFGTRGLRQLTDDGQPKSDPAWSPDGSRIAYVDGTVGGRSLVLLELSAAGIRQLDTGPGDSVDPSWSPDGLGLAFADDRSGDFDLFMLDLASGSVSPLYAAPGDQLAPVWRSNSTVAFVSWPSGLGSGDAEVTVLNPATGSLDVLTQAPPSATGLAWSPDGRWLAVAAADPATGSGIWVSEVGLGLFTQIPGRNEETQPSWRAR